MLDGGIFQAGAAGLSFANAFVIDASTGTIDTQANTLTLSGSISDGIGSTGGLTKIGGGTLVLSGTSSYTGATNVNAGTLQAGAANAFAPQSLFNVASGAVLDLNGFNETLGSLAGAGNVTLGSGTLTAGGNNASTTYSGAISGSGGFNKAGSGTLLLTGTSDYTGVTNIDGGTFEVDGAITSSSSVNVNAGSTLTGVGTVDPSTVTIGSGSNFVPGTAGVPGTSMTIAGNLAFQSGALYLVYLNQTTSTFANVTGAAALAGTVQAMFSPGSVAAKQYTILQSAGLNGTTFTGVAAPPNFTGTLSYSADDVFLKVSAALGLGTALNQNQQSAANAINAFFNGGGALPRGLHQPVWTNGQWPRSNADAVGRRECDGSGACRIRTDQRIPGPDARSVRLWPRRSGERRRAARFCAGSASELPAGCGACLCGPAQGSAQAIFRPALDSVGRELRRQRYVQR